MISYTYPDVSLVELTSIPFYKLPYPVTRVGSDSDQSDYLFPSLKRSSQQFFVLEVFPVDVDPVPG